MPFRSLLPAFLLATMLAALMVRAADSTLTEAQRENIAFEALSRLEGADLNQKPELKAAVLKVLDKTRDPTRLVKLIKQFQITGRDSALLDIATAKPASDTGVEAIRLVLAHQNTNLLSLVLQGADSVTAIKAAEALGNAAQKQAVPLLLPLVTDERRNVELRKQAVRSLARTSDGATQLVGMARDQELPEDLYFTAATELNAVHWSFIKAKAAKYLPLPAGQNSKPLPPTAELLKMSGDPTRGSAIFYRAQPGCSACHQIKERGGQVGPDLSEIGTKLGKAAIIEAILDPNAGISVGYETTSIGLNSGDEAYGIVVSDTADEVAIKDTKGIVTHYKKSDISARLPLKTSLMPTGLQQGTTTQEFVDLVEFLASLKKVP